MRPLVGEERREFQRLHLDPPIEGTLGSAPVTILEVGVLGSRVRHESPLESEQADLRFQFNGIEVGMRCEVIRTLPSQSGSGLESGLRFAAAIGESGDLLREMLGDLVTKALDQRREAPPANPNPVQVDGDKTVRGVDAGFVSYRFEKGLWRKRRVFLPEQPSTGFTVAKDEDMSEIHRLCRVFEASDEEGQRLIRLFAELSVCEKLDIPPRMSS